MIFSLACGKVEVSYKILCPLWTFWLLRVLKRIPVKLRIKVTVSGLFMIGIFSAGYFSVVHDGTGGGF